MRDVAGFGFKGEIEWQIGQSPLGTVEWQIGQSPLGTVGSKQWLFCCFWAALAAALAGAKAAEVPPVLETQAWVPFP
jgi:hypothetical protein